ncbi:MAG TPA: hypothetical protein VE178_14780, partial [Silvibacterium sp.]|nr:hypothetical protein [Silvibacterium sp.]
MEAGSEILAAKVGKGFAALMEVIGRSPLRTNGIDCKHIYGFRGKSIPKLAGIEGLHLHQEYRPGSGAKSVREYSGNRICNNRGNRSSHRCKPWNQNEVQCYIDYRSG